MPTAARLPTASPMPAAPVSAATPVPKPLPLPLPPPPVFRATPAPEQLNSASATLPPSAAPAFSWLGDRPPWVSACLAVLVCVTASGSGAYLVRSLKQRQQPTRALSSAAPQPLTSGRAASAGSQPGEPIRNQPLVVDLQSLSVEHRVPRTTVRPAAPPSVNRATQGSTEPSTEGADPSSGAPALWQGAPSKSKISSIPSAARANPDMTGSDHSDASKALTTGSDKPGF